MPEPDVPGGDVFVPQPDAHGRLKIAPTDVATFISMEQCQRALRLRLDEGNRAGSNVFKEYGVRKQQIAPIRNRQGRLFEESVEAQLGGTSLATSGKRRPGPVDGAPLVAAARSLQPGNVRTFFQAPIAAVVGNWNLSGIADLVRLHRWPDGTLRALIVDIKASARAKVEHRLQVAFYERMLREMLAANGVALASVEVGVLYRGPLADEPTEPLVRARLDKDRKRAIAEFGAHDLYLEIVEDLAAYREDVDRFVFGEGSVAEAVAAGRFADLPYHVEGKCDSCVFGEVCVKWSSEQRDLSLVPFITKDQKQALWDHGITTTGQLATLMPREEGARHRGADRRRRPAVPEHRLTVEDLNTIRSVGPDLDPLVWRAQRIEDFAAGTWTPPPAGRDAARSSLPASRPDLHPNLVTVYLDAQSDPMTDRLFLLGALVTAADGGTVTAERTARVVRVAPGPVETNLAEESLLIDWLDDLLRAVAELAVPDAEGQRKAPVHLVLWSGGERDLLLNALGRHTEKAQGSTSLALFLDPTAATDSPTLSLLRDDLRATRDLPLWFQTLQSVSSWMKFDWSEVRTIFRERMFDARDAFPVGDGRQTFRYVRPRFNSGVPAEYAYAAWGELDDQPVQGLPGDAFARYRKATLPDLERLGELRVDALRHIADRLPADPDIVKTAWAIPDLAELVPPHESFAKALKDFLLVERTLEVGAWKAARSGPAEERMLAGITLIAQYHEADQTDEELVRRNAHRVAWEARREERLRALQAINPAATWSDLPKGPDDPEPAGLAKFRVRLRLTPAPDLAADEMLGLTELRAGSRVVVLPQFYDPRPDEDGTLVRHAVRPSSLLKGMRASIVGLPEPGEAGERPMVELDLLGIGSGTPPFTYGSRPPVFREGEAYTLDDDVSSPAASQVARALDRVLGLDGNPPDPNTLVGRLSGSPRPEDPIWPAAAVAGQARFLHGLDAMRGVNGFHVMEGRDVRLYIGERGDSPLLLVQGPPGTGKSYSTAFALLARMQGAMDAGLPCRVFLCANTHAAVNVLLDNVVEVQDKLRKWRAAGPARYRSWFRDELVDVPIFRHVPQHGTPPGVVVFPRHEDREIDPESGQKAERATNVIRSFDHCFVAATPGGVSNLYSGLSARVNRLFSVLVLDEASRMTLPEAVLAAKGLRADGTIIVVGDHRQMQPIRSKAWENDPRQAWEATAPFESAYDALRGRGVDQLKLEESFRLHTDMADFLQDQIYAQDDIEFHSKRTQTLAVADDADPFVAAVLRPDHPLVVVVHDEQRSQLRNDFEAKLTQRIVGGVLSRPEVAAKGASKGYGVVVPHRSQRARIGPLLQDLAGDDPVERRQAFEAVDTVERFQGGERDVIVISATESDPVYLLNSGGFLYEPTRLTVALSRAKLKLVLVASSAVFNLFSPDETLHANIRLWRNLLRDYCTKELWSGTVPFGGSEIGVRVVGNMPRSDGSC